MASQLPAHKERRDLDQILSEVVHNPGAVEIVFVNKRQQACMGPGGPLGHPIVYYTIGEKGYAECMYCDRVFVYDEKRAGETITQV